MDFAAVLTSAELDGVAPTADWSRWIRSGRAPNSGDGAGFAVGIQARDDLAQLAALGFDSVVLTAEWARLEPRHRHHDRDEIERLTQRLVWAREAGLQPWLCLIDGTRPGWFVDDEGGFDDERGRTLIWPRHIDWIGETFGDQVAGWIPQREPLLWAIRRHLLGTAPPGHRDPLAASEAVQAAMLADAEAWRLLAGTAPVAAYHTARLIRAAPNRVHPGADNVGAQRQATLVERLLWHPWLAALGEGRLIAGDLAEIDVPDLRGAFDRVVVEARGLITVEDDGTWTAEAPRAAHRIEALHRAADELSDHDIVGAGSLAGVVDDGRSRPDHQQDLLVGVVDVSTSTRLRGWWQSSPIDGYGLQHGFPRSDARAAVISTDRTVTPAAETVARFIAGADRQPSGRGDNSSAHRDGN